MQLTVENLVRARELPEAEFDEVFRESTATLGMEIANLKTIIGRFSDFSKMPKPELERIDARDAIERVRSLYEAAGSQDAAKIRFEVQLSAEPMPLDADPELLHRALSNLVLNAMDAMPEGGTLTLSAKPRGDRVEIRVADTGAGNDAGGMRAAVHPLLHNQAARHRPRPGHCAVGSRRPWRRHRGRKPDGRRRYLCHHAAQRQLIAVSF